MIIGTKTIGSSFRTMVADKRVLMVLGSSLSLSTVPSKVTAYVDGLGSGSGSQRLKALLYVNAALVAESVEVIVASGSAGAWLDFEFTDFPDVSEPVVVDPTQPALGFTPVITGAISASNSNTTFTRTSASTNSWDSQVYSTESYTTNCYATARATHGTLFGLNSDPATSASDTTIDYCIQHWANSTYIYENGTQKLVAAGGTATDVLAVTYDGVNIRYLRNGSVLYTTARAVGSPLFFDSSFYYPVALTSVGFGNTSLAIGFMAGTASNVARVAFNTPGNCFVDNSVYDNGALATAVWSGVSENATLSAFAVVRPLWQPPAASIVDDEYLAGLSFTSAQNAFTRDSAPVVGTNKTVTAGWHGTYVNDSKGSFAVVKTDGLLADFVGERVLVTHRLTRRSVAVYVITESDLITEEISLARRPWIALGSPSDGNLLVSAQVLG